MRTDTRLNPSTSPAELPKAKRLHPFGAGARLSVAILLFGGLP